MGQAMVAHYCQSFRHVPRRIVLDIDDTFDAVHGGQQLRLFNAHYDEYGFQPIVVTLVAPGNLVAGQIAGGDGTITDDGPGTTLAVGGNLIVGQGGAGTLAVTNGAAFLVGGTLQVGGSIGVGTVTDTGDGFRTFGALAIDNGVANVAPGITNLWNVDFGSAQNIDIGAVAGGNATLDVVATGTVIEGSGTVTVGAAGAGTLAIGANALFDAPVNAVTIGGASGANGLVTLDGAAPSWTAGP